MTCDLVIEPRCSRERLLRLYKLAVIDGHRGVADHLLRALEDSPEASRHANRYSTKRTCGALVGRSVQRAAHARVRAAVTSAVDAGLDATRDYAIDTHRSASHPSALSASTSITASAIAVSSGVCEMKNSRS